MKIYKITSNSKPPFTQNKWKTDKCFAFYNTLDIISIEKQKEKRRGQLQDQKSKLCAVFVSFKHVMKVFCILCGLLIFHVKLF